MSGSRSDDQSQQKLLHRALADYAERVSRGEQVDRQAFLAQYPDVADALSDYFQEADRSVTVDRSPSTGEKVPPHAPAPDGGLGGDETEIAADTSKFRAAWNRVRPGLPPDEVGRHGPAVSSDQGPADSGRAVVDQNAPTVLPDSASAQPTEGTQELKASPPVDAAADRGFPRRFDDYELLEEIARGGMGVVYKARQVSIHRLVAVKMILSRQLAGEAELRRFQTEAEAVGRLQQPNIVQIYGVGNAGGQPYLALEFVEGGSLARKLSGTPQPARQAAELIETLARAIHCAHQRGIVHRDLKPANVLLTLEGVPKIADFGLAKRVEADAGETRTGVILGTPSYMAPEQAAGSAKNVGPPADVYALGAILFEALTGRPPFRAETPMETVVQVLADEPVPPRRLLPRLPRDLETICLKCLEKTIHRRYDSAAALADDLRRFLEGKPIRARPVRAWERAIKWARRRPALAGLIVVSILALFTLVFGGVWYNAQLQGALDQSEQNLETAHWNLGVAHGAVNRMLERVADDLAPIPHTEHVRRKLLEEALLFYRATVRRSATDPAARELVAGAYLKIGDVHGLLGALPEAEEAYLKSIEVSEPLTAEFPEVTEYLLALAGAHNNLANLWRSEGRNDEAEANYRRALELVTPLLGKGDNEPEKQAGRIYNNLGVLLSGRGNTAAAEAAHQRALDLRRQLVRQSPDEPEHRTDLAVSYSNLGALRLYAREYQQAAEAFQRADQFFQVEDERSLAPQKRSAWARVRSNLGAAFQELGRGAEAETAFRGAVQIESTLVDDFPSITVFRSELAGVYFNLGRQLTFNEKIAAAHEAFGEAAELYESLAAEFPNNQSYPAEAAQCRRILEVLQAEEPSGPPASPPTTPHGG